MTNQELVDFVNRADVTVELDRTVNPPPGESRKWVAKCNVSIGTVSYSFKSLPFESITDFVSSATVAIEKADAWLSARDAAVALLAAEGY